MHSDQRKLNEAGYLTKEFTPYHFQVRQRVDKLNKINVWPTAKKILKEFEAGPAPQYTDILVAVKEIFAYKKKRFRYTPIVPPIYWEQEVAIERLNRYKKDPLTYILTKQYEKEDYF